MAAIDALAQERRTARPVPAVMARLKIRRPEVRAAAAEGLGRSARARTGSRRFGRRIDPTRARLCAQRRPPRCCKLNDTSGLAMLRECWSASSPERRLAGARRWPTRPMGVDRRGARAGATGGEPTIRLAAARLIASTDPALAKAVADALAADTNLAVRELATRVQAEAGWPRPRPAPRLLRSAGPPHAGQGRRRNPGRHTLTYALAHFYGRAFTILLTSPTGNLGSCR